MIIIYFIIDYIVMSLLPVSTYFILLDLEKNKIFDVVVVGFIIDILYRKFFLFTVFLLILYCIFKKINVKNKYRFLKNIIVYVFALILLNIM